MSRIDSLNNSSLFVRSFYRVMSTTVVILGVMSVGCGKSIGMEMNRSSGVAPSLPTDPSNPPGPVSRITCLSGDRVTWQFMQPECPTNSKVDILFVVDASPSMQDLRSKIAVYVPELLRKLPIEMDYRVAVMLGNGGASYRSGRLYASKNSPFVMNSRVEKTDLMQQELAQTLAEEVSDADDADGKALLYSLNRSLDADRLSEIQARGFYRPDAALAVVFITNRADLCDSSSSGSPAFNKYCTDSQLGSVDMASLTYSKLKAFKGNLPLILGGFLPSSQSVTPGLSEFLAERAGSLRIDIENDPYRSDLDGFKDLLVSDLSVLTQFHLSGSDAILPNTMTVTVDGTPVSVDFSSNDRTVSLQIEQAGHSGSLVEVTACEQSPTSVF
jgi:hypothetical protein